MAGTRSLTPDLKISQSRSAEAPSVRYSITTDCIMVPSSQALCPELPGKIFRNGFHISCSGVFHSWIELRLHSGGKQIFAVHESESSLLSVFKNCGHARKSQSMILRANVVGCHFPSPRILTQDQTGLRPAGRAALPAKGLGPKLTRHPLLLRLFL